MTSRELYIKTISNEFARWEIQIGHMNSISLFDSNIISEHTLCELLNLAFDYQLVNANGVTANFPAVDLIDQTNKIAFQVTSASKTVKIQTTLHKFVQNELHLHYDQLFIFILGTKQKKYSALKIPSALTFDPQEQVLDFKSLLKIIARLPLNRIDKIACLLNKENIQPSKSKSLSNEAIIKKRLAMKKRIQKDFIREIDRKDWEYMWHEPWIKFTYSNAVIRSVDDKSFPAVEDWEKGKMSGWIKGEFWDLYENGIELITHGGKAIFDKDDNWDIINWKEDDREANENYRKESFHTFLRIPYEYIVDYDMQPDPYYSIPTIYVTYAKDNMPYEEIVYGRPGYYDKENRLNSYHTYYFEKEKRKTLP